MAVRDGFMALLCLPNCDGELILKKSMRGQFALTFRYVGAVSARTEAADYKTTKTIM